MKNRRPLPRDSPHWPQQRFVAPLFPPPPSAPSPSRRRQRSAPSTFPRRDLPPPFPHHDSLCRHRSRSAVILPFQPCLWGGSVLNLGTKKHSVEYPGCFAMTKLHHGKMDVANELFDSFPGKGLRAGDIDMYGALINGYCKNGMWVKLGASLWKLLVKGIAMTP